MRQDLQRTAWVAASVAVLLPFAYVGANSWVRRRGMLLPFGVEYASTLFVMAMAIYASVAAAQRLSRWWFLLTGIWVLVLGFALFTGVSASW